MGKKEKRSDDLIVAVTGGRSFNSWNCVDLAMSSMEKQAAILGRKLRVIHGDARGLDALVKRWCIINNVPQTPFPARWGDLTQPGSAIRRRRDGSLYDAAEGFRRNRRMLDEGRPELLIAFPGGRGTADAVAAARERSVEVGFVNDSDGRKELKEDDVPDREKDDSDHS